MVVNGIMAWRILHRTAQVRGKQAILVLGQPGVGTTLVQLAARGLEPLSNGRSTNFFTSGRDAAARS